MCGHGVKDSKINCMGKNEHLNEENSWNPQICQWHGLPKSDRDWEQSHIEQGMQKHDNDNNNNKQKIVCVESTQHRTVIL